MSGNILQQQTEKILENSGWEISSEVFYTDPITQKPREKDIIAKKEQNNYDYDVILFVECKIIPEDTTIEQKSKIGDNEISSLNARSIPFADIQELEKNRKTHFYHYQKFFKSRDTKDFLYKAINQNLQSFSAFRQNCDKNYLCYLIVVYDTNVYYLDNNNQKQKCDKALIKINTIDSTFNLSNRECFIEIVSVNDFENLLKEIDEDIKEINGSANFYRHMEQNRINKNKRDRRADNDFSCY